jgi:DDE superfamily endonuclease
LKLALENPRSLKAGVLQIAEKLGARLSPYTLKRLLKSRDCVWKRMRRSSRGKRNEQDYQMAKAHLDKLRAACGAADRDFDLIYFDGAGFNLTPCVPYAWQLRGETLEIDSAHSPRLNVLGFLNLNGSFESYVFKGSIDSEVLIRCFDDYCQKMKKPALIVLDNAPVHRSAAFESRIESWEEQGLYLLFLPPYCPELNLIEILWRKIKYEWLPVSAYQSFKDLSEALDEVLRGVRSKYRLSFAH